MPSIETTWNDPSTSRLVSLPKSWWRVETGNNVVKQLLPLAKGTLLEIDTIDTVGEPVVVMKLDGCLSSEEHCSAEIAQLLCAD